MPAMPLRIEIDIAEHMRGEPAHRIDALRLVDEADAGNAEIEDRLALGRAHLALEPHEAGSAACSFWRSVLASRSGTVRGQKFDRLVDIDDLARIGEERGTGTSLASTMPLRSTMSGRGMRRCMRRRGFLRRAEIGSTV